MNATRHVQVDKREANGSFRRSRNHYFYLASLLPGITSTWHHLYLIV